MSVSGWLANPQFRDYVRSLRELHALIRTGQDESEAGQRLRDRMDSLGQDLPAEASHLLHELSSDFYDIADRNHHPVRRMTREAQRALNDVVNLKSDSDPLTRLSLLRKYRVYLEPCTLAYVRAMVWYEAEEPRIASDYFRNAAELQPLDPHFPVWWLESLAKGDRPAAIIEARALLRDDSVRRNSRLRFQAAEVLFTEATQSDEETARPVYQELAPVFLELSQDSRLLVDEPSILTGAHALLGFCRERLGDVEGAIEAFTNALEVDPRHDAMLTAKAMLLYAEQPELAVRDFHSAIRCDTDLAAPYHYLGHYYLRLGDYKNARRMADEAASRSKSNRVRAECHEWKAICLAGSGASRDAVLAEFEAAESLDPNQSRIRENKGRYVSSANGLPAWKLPTAEEFHAASWAEVQRISLERAHTRSGPADRALAV